MQEVRNKRERTCIGCGTKSGKTVLYRIVRTKDGGVSFDATGRVPGRGAYVCSMKCLEEAVRAQKLQRALRTGIDKADAMRVVNEMEEALTRARVV